MISQNLLLGSDGYLIQRSLRFRASASAYLNRTPSSASNRTTWTWSGWVKRGSLGIYGQLFSARNSDNNNFGLLFFNDDTLYFADQTVPTYNIQFKTTQVFRDPSASYHIVLSIDTTQATNTNRVKLYVNGLQVSSFSTATYPSQNLNTYVNTTNAHNIGAFTGGSNHFDGYLSELNFIDGQALTPSSFGEIDPITGVWKAKKYAGTYGTNGFYLPFSDNSSTTTLGYDKSGNSNNWTCNNISLTAGSTYDSMTDVPTLTSATQANYAVLNPNVNLNGTLTNGNLTTTGNYQSSIGISSGKIYWETEIVSSNGYTAVGFTNGPYSQYFRWNVAGGSFTNASAGTLNIGTQTGQANCIVMCAIDVDNNKFFIGVNGTWFASGNPSSGANPAITLSASSTELWFPEINLYAGGTGHINFGQRPFAYTPPTGFVALNTFNLPEPSIKAGNKHFDAVTWTGNDVNNRLIANGGGFQPDLVWAKARNQAYSHTLYDVIRGGANKLSSNITDAESTNYANGQVSFQPTGFNAVAGSNGSITINETGTNYVGWQWKAGGSAVSNTAGSITSQVSANPSAGFSVVTYTGNASVASFGHGLGVAPKFIIIKNRSASGTGAQWCVGADVSGWNWATDYLYLNSTIAKATDGGTTQFYSAPTSSVVNIGGGTNTNGSGNSMVAYCFSEVAGYSKFGSYTGNGSADGTFVHLGFRPRLLMVKSSSSAQDWKLIDTARNTYNSSNSLLGANVSSAEDTNSAYDFDILSNGFKPRNTFGYANSSGATYIYMAFAENPFKHSLAR